VSLSQILQQYPRTDAGAAATVALATIADNERHKLMTQIESLRREQAALKKQIAAQSDRVQTLENRPPPAPVIIHETPKPAPPARKKPATRHRRRR